MAERNPTKNPQITAGTVLESGTPNTGQVLGTHGGSKNHSVLSGTAGGDAAIHVGGGRLDKVCLHPSTIPAASGVAIVFYDAAVAVSGGPLSASGHKVVAAIKHPNNPNVSGLIQTPTIHDAGFVFTSGLCHTGASGQVGFNASYTPVVSG